MGDADHEEQPPLRRLRFIVLAAVALTVLLGLLFSGLARALGGENTLLAMAATALTLLGHMWAARWRFLVPLLLTAAPGLLLAGAVGLAGRPGQDFVDPIVLTAAAAVLTAATAPVAGWIGNRFGHRRPSRFLAFLDGSHGWGSL